MSDSRHLSSAKKSCNAAWSRGGSKLLFWATKGALRLASLAIGYLASSSAADIVVDGREELQSDGMGSDYRQKREEVYLFLLDPRGCLTISSPFDGVFRR